MPRIFASLTTALAAVRALATRSLMTGVNLTYSHRQLGHRDTSMLLKHYAKGIDGTDKDAEVAKMNQAYGLSKPSIKPKRQAAQWSAIGPNSA